MFERNLMRLRRESEIVCDSKNAGVSESAGVSVRLSETLFYSSLAPLRSIHLCVCMFVTEGQGGCVRECVCLSVCVAVCMSDSMCVSFRLSDSLCVCLKLSTSVHLCVCLPA